MKTMHMRPENERGVAMLTSLLVMMLMSALLVGFTAVVMSDQRYRFIDRDRNQAFYAASAGIEKLTSDLGNLFVSHVAPTATQITNLTTTTPVIEGVAFNSPMPAGTIPTSALTKCIAPNAIASAGGNGYAIRFCAAPGGNPTTTSVTPIKSGPYEGLIAAQMPYQLDVTAKTTSGGDVHLVRTAEAVAIPVFQFGIFSDVDLSFFAGPNFNFGGRVHTNGNLFLSQGNSATLTLTDKVTAVGQVVRQRMQNGVSIDTAPAHAGTVSMAMSPGVFRPLLRTEGSVTDGIGSSNNEPLWHSTSLSTYNSWIRNGRTGAKPLNLALITVGGSNPDLIRRPPSNEDINNPVLYNERLFSKASLRVLLSDEPEDITGLPTVTATPPVLLDNLWTTATAPNNGVGAYGPINYNMTAPVRPPIARSPGLVTANVTPAVVAGASVEVRYTGLSTVNYFKIPDALTIVKTGAGAGTWNLSGCAAQKTATTFTCTNTGGHAGTTAAGATVTGDVVTPDGTIPVTTTTTANWVGGGALTVTSTLAFAPHTFWVGRNLISCGGYPTTNDRLTQCNVVENIANNTTMTSSARSALGTGTIGGYLKIERQSAAGIWTDVTMEILNWGIGAPRIAGCNSGWANDPTPNAILRLQRLADNNWPTAATCPQNLNRSTEYWPNTLFDVREALVRDVSPGTATVPLGGVMHYISLDVGNLSRWFRAGGVYTAPAGTDSRLDNGGYTVYFSDRRNNRNAISEETGDYGWEDIVNPLSGTGAPNGILDTGEDANGNGTLDVYGSFPNYDGTYNAAVPGASAPLTTAARPATMVSRGDAQVNRAILYRRALKVRNGNNIVGLGVTGLTVVSENPVYVEGNWNSANGGGSDFAGAHAATAVMADTVTLLSNSWSDVTSFTSPYTVGDRDRNTQTWYRLAIISGKGRAFPQPTGTDTDFGTDGGAHNFLRYLENGDQAVNYRGSMATFFFSRQALGTFKCCDTVYGAPTRNYAFDTDFLNPALLPPNTPMFRDLNTVGFAQELRPGR